MKIDLQATKVGGFNYEFLRAISYQKTEGAELGECVATAAHIHEGDFDSWIQEWTRLADRVAQEAAADLGWHCLIFEGPGQRGALHLNPGLILRPDYEIPVSTVVDYVLARPEIDHERLALIGYSLGGYLAPRAAAFEPRIKACIANSLVVDLDEAWRAAWPAPLRTAPTAVFDAVFATLSRTNHDVRWGMDHVRWAMGIQHPHEFFSAWKPYTLWGLEERLQCPLLCLFGEDELAAVNQKVIEETVRYIDALRCSKTVHLFTREEGAASHCQMGGLSRAQAVIFDWFEETFSREVLAQQGKKMPVAELPAEIFAILEKHHGKEIVRNLQGLDLFRNQRGSTDE